MDKIGSTDPSASKEDLAKVKQDVDQLAAKQNTIADKQNDISAKQNALEGKENSVVISQSDLAAKLDASTANLQTSLENQTKELKKYVDNIPPPANVPVGTVVDWAGDGRGHPVPPKGWLFCDGSYLKITEHPKLYAVLKNNYDSFDAGDLGHQSHAPVGEFMLPPSEHTNYENDGYADGFSSYDGDYLPTYTEEYSPDHNTKPYVVHMLKIIKDD